MELLISAIKNEKFAFYLENIQEVMEKTEVEEVPNSPKIMEGIFNYRNNIIPVFSLRQIIDQSSFLEEQLKILSNSKKAYSQWIKNFDSSGKDPQIIDFEKWIETNIKCMKCNYLGFVDLIKNNILNYNNELNSVVDKKSLKNQEYGKKLCKKIVTGIEILEDNIQLLVGAFQKVIIYSLDGKNFGITVDNVDKIIDIDSKNIKKSDVQTTSSVVAADNIVEIDQKIVLIIEFNEDIFNYFDSFSRAQ